MMNALGGLASLAAPVVTGLLGAEAPGMPISPMPNAGLDAQYLMAASRISDPSFYEEPPPQWGVLLAVGALTFAAVYLATPAA